jgi:hypothetical protein
MLIVDEAAAFKKQLQAPRPASTVCRKFMGSGGDGSKRAWQLDFRAAAVRQRTGRLGHRPAHRDTGQELAARVLQPDSADRSARVLQPRPDGPRAVHRPLPAHREPRDHRHDAQGVDAQRRRRLQKSRRHAHDHPPLRRVSHRRRGGPDPARAAHRAGPRAAGPRAGGPVRRARPKARAHAPAVADQGQQPEQDPGSARAPLTRRLARKARWGAWNTTRRSPPSPPPITPRPS